MLRRGLLCLALLAPAGARAADRELPGTLEGIEAEAEPLARELGDKVEELAELLNLYADDGRFEELAERRRRLREAVLPGLDRLVRLEEAYDELKKASHLREATMGFAALNDVRRIQAEGGAKIARALAIEQAHRRLVEAKRRARAVLQADDFNFNTTAAAIEARRRRWKLAGAAAALAVLLGGGAFWAGRRRAASPEAAGATEIGSVIGGNFRVEREVGRGAMGRVFEALDVTLGRKVAIKRMRDELLQSPKDLEMFLAEARLVASLKHPNIVEIYSIVKEAGRLYLVFEFVGGKPLNTVLQERGRLTLAAARGVAADVAAALDYAHSQKIIHRDLKPANVMLGADGRAKVMDFGIAHQATATVARLTRAEAWGTPPYMAPEAELGRVGRESDLYSLGVCLYEMLTGKLPFEGPNFLAQKRELRLQPASQLEPSLGPAVDRTLQRALQPEPEARFHSAAELVAQLG